MRRLICLKPRRPVSPASGNWGDDHGPKVIYDDLLAKASALRAFLPAIMQTDDNVSANTIIE